MIQGYTIAIFGTTFEILGASNIPVPDKASCINLSAINSTNPMSEDKWLKLDILGWEIKNVQVDESQRRVGEVSVHSPTQYREHTIKLKAIKFPEDNWIKEKIESIFRKPDLLIHKGTYQYINNIDTSKNFMPHPDGMCLKVAGGISEEYKYDNGDLEIVLTLKNVLPYYVDRTV